MTQAASLPRLGFVPDWLANRRVPPVLGPNRLRAVRLARGLMQDELADRAGVSRRTIAAIEAGNDTSMITAQRLASALDTNLDTLFAQYSLEDFLKDGAFDEDTYMRLTAALDRRASVAIAGRVCSGKTVLLNACIRRIERSEPAIGVEDPNGELTFVYPTMTVAGRIGTSPRDNILVFAEMDRLSVDFAIPHMTATENQVFTTVHASNADEARRRLAVFFECDAGKVPGERATPREAAEAAHFAREAFPVVTFIELDRESGRATIEVLDEEAVDDNEEPAE